MSGLNAGVGWDWAAVEAGCEYGTVASTAEQWVKHRSRHAVTNLKHKGRTW